jgi:hypothetical protein
MKKLFSVAALLFAAIMTFAQNAPSQVNAVQPETESISVNTVFLVVCVSMAALFLFTIVYSLSKAVTALSSQVNSK